MQIKIEILKKDDSTYMECTSENEVFMVFNEAYEEGDKIRVSCYCTNVFVILKLDECMDSTFVFLKDALVYEIPFGIMKVSLNSKCFVGKRHYLYAREASKEEIELRKNLALNPYDTHENTELFPHVFANDETDSESVFAARNAIDGLIANTFHGEWPYTSWGINMNPDATLTVDFGREVRVDTIVLYLRADFPHDSWWRSVDVQFSDDTNIRFGLKKKNTAQSFSFGAKTITYLRLENLVKAEDKSFFPALTQIQVFGKESFVEE